MKNIKLDELNPGFINILDSETNTFASWIDNWSELIIFDPNWDKIGLMKGNHTYIPMPSREDLFRYFQENDMVIVENF